jgi:hypothetical protein
MASALEPTMALLPKPIRIALDCSPGCRSELHVASGEGGDVVLTRIEDRADPLDLPLISEVLVPRSVVAHLILVLKTLLDGGEQ